MIDREKLAELRARRAIENKDVCVVETEQHKGHVETKVEILPKQPVHYSRERLQEFIQGTLFLPTWRVVLLWYGLVNGLVLSIMNLRSVPPPCQTANCLESLLILLGFRYPV